ncbi:MAG TPA: protein-glutamate O-methyltransferase CheR [Tepidiformaceae bacterium]|nr:protein-glutamate O-methyltransferase CheR [Tepidiformaceae bacterium]
MTAIEPAADDREWLAFRDTLEKAIGVPLGAYKEPQMKRRLAAVMARRGVADWTAFAAAIKAQPPLLNEVRDTLTINVSEFFRQPERFSDLQQRIFPALMEKRKQLKIWSAGCSIGCEPYTLAMILNEIDPRGGHTILATDVDIPVLSRARDGRGYLASEVRSVPEPVLKKYFTREGETYAVNDTVKRMVTFRHHDLLKDPYPSDLDVILCRNVVIYFTEQAKHVIYTGFTQALRPGGYLFVGGSELISRSRDLGLKTDGTSLYPRAA